MFAVVTVTSFSTAAVWAVAAVLRLEAKLSLFTLLSAAGGMLLLQTAAAAYFVRRIKKVEAAMSGFIK
ncbi:hypothetical protein [Paenibacillus sp. FSL H8-0537]|uniref:hypothetical protein n=1 Tax=Paenibacillus sp. FSL H8-0537 TaxID=2921399 RepID=UPI003100BC1D